MIATSDLSYGAVFRLPSVAKLAVSSLFARTGTQMFSVLIVLFTLSTYRSASFSGIVVLCSQLPGILFSPIAGALLDRNARIPLMVLDYAVESMAIAAIGALSLAHILPKTLLLVIVLLSSFTQPLSRVGTRTLFPMIVPRELWDRSNAIDSTCLVTANVLGPALAGIAVAIVGAPAANLVVAGIFLLAVVSLSTVRIPQQVFVRTTTLLGDAKQAIHYVFGNRVLRMLAVSMSFYYGAFNAVIVAVPVLVLRRLHGTSTSVGLVIAVMGFMGFVGGLVTGRFGTSGREKAFIAYSCAITGLTFGLLGTAHGYLLLIPAMALIGLSSAPLTVAMFSLRQRATDPAWFGRAFAVSMNLNYSLSPIFAAIVGSIVEHSISAAFFFLAICTLVAGVWPAVLPASHYGPSEPYDGLLPQRERNEQGVVGLVSMPIEPHDD